MVLILETNILVFFSYYYLGEVMKYRYFILPVIIISMMIFIVDYDKGIVNKYVFSDDKEVNYPFFGNDKIDNYINNYLSSYIDNDDNIFIDYDYSNDDNNYYLTFYKYILNGNIINDSSDNFVIDMDNNSINRIYDSYYEYDFITNSDRDDDRKLIAITFDDGPNYNTNKILNILEKYDAKATFFVLGSRIHGNEYILKRMVSDGNEIGNHTYSHLLLTKYKENKIREEIEATSDLIFDVTKKRPRLLRPSYGSFNKTIKKLAGSPIIIWDIDTLDWKYHNSNRISKRVISKVKDGDIVLMHDIYSATANALEVIIPTLKDMGYEFVTVSDLFYYKGITLENGKVYGYAR